MWGVSDNDSIVCISSYEWYKVEHWNIVPKRDQAYLFLRGLHRKGQQYAWKTCSLQVMINRKRRQAAHSLATSLLSSLLGLVKTVQSHSQLCCPHYGNGPTRALPSWLTLGINAAGILVQTLKSRMWSAALIFRVFSVDLSSASFMFIFHLNVPRHT